MLIINLLLAFFISISLAPSVSFSTEINLPRDTTGWTIFTPSSDSRIMYVAVDGDDTVAASTGVYTSANHPDWSHPMPQPAHPIPMSCSSALISQGQE